MIDYAHPMMMAEKAMKSAYDNMLHNDPDKALADLLQVIVEARLAIAAIKHSKETTE